jgi:hypothetical protein
MYISRTIKYFFLLQVFIRGLQVNLYSQVVINEIMASNATVITDIDYGNYCDWIELYNTTSGTIDLGDYFLSDDPANPAMWQFPTGSLIAAHSYFLVYADDSGNGRHTNFQLSKEGEKILLVNRQMSIVDSFSFPYQLTDISFGRKWNDPPVIGFFTSPTPGKINDNEMVRGISPAPVFSVNGGFYSGPLTIGISVVSQNGEIFYSLDGTEPTMASIPYTEPIIIEATSVLRVKTFENGLLPGLTITQSYFIFEPMNLPVISLVTDPDHFFSEETGIYVQGTAGVPGYCTSVPHNVNQDWERPVNIELFEKDGTAGLNQLAGVKIFGGCSRVRFPVKSLALYARKEYETSSFKYQLFPDKPCREYESFILRTSADDQPYTMFRDALAHMLVKDTIDIDVMAYRPAVLYINGKYWGIHNIREKINEHYSTDNYGVNSDSVDMLERNPADSWNTINGSAKDYNSMIDYLHKNDITQSIHYDYISKQMDIDEYINYQITQIFLGGRDWPGNNIKFWRSNEKPYDRWRWILCDLDYTLTEFFSDIMDEATMVDCGCIWPNPPWSTYLFRRLLENETFRDEFIQRFFLYSETCFSRERIHGLIDEFQAAIAPEIPRHIERWGGQKTNLPDNTWVTPIFSSVEKWKENVQRLRDFTDTRHEIAKKHVMDYFGISGLNGFTANVEPAGLGNIVVGNTLLTNSSVSADICSGQKLEVNCILEPGYILSHWEVTRKQEKDSTLIRRGDSWRYMESWWDPAPDWRALNYDDGYWDTENAEFGYGDGDEATVIGYGDNPQNKMITAWFRKKFSIEDKNVFTRYTMHLKRDDGARVFLNGMEVIRDNLDRWWIGGYSPALKAIDGTDETYFHTFQLNPALFREGENIIAVEIHQVSGSSEDLSFDMDLMATCLNEGYSEILNENTLTLELTGTTVVTARIIPDTNRVEEVYINEVMAKNSSGYTDEYGEYEDWIELYNKGIAPVDLAGLYLSDTLSVFNAWLIPEGHPEITTILPGDFLVFAADNEPLEGILHAGFRLAKEGDQVALMQIIGKDTLVVDYLKFGSQDENVSWGRYPDGSGGFEFMPVSTPHAANFMEPDITYVDELLLFENVIIYPIPTEGRFFVKFKESFLTGSDVVQINIFSGTGILVSATQHRTSHLIELSLSDQPEGLYLLRIIKGDEIYNKRIVVF